MRKVNVGALAGILLTVLPPLSAAAQPAATELGAMPAEAQFPQVEFAFEARITLGPARVVGETATGQRQYIPITGGTIAVRGLSLTRSGVAHLLGGELRTGMLLGAILGLASFLPVWYFFGEVRLAAAVSSAIFAAGTLAAGLGLLLPWWLSRAGRDPALGSGPLATVTQDILSLLVYFAMVRAFGA